MFVKLNCVYGNDKPDDVIEVDDKVGENLVKDGNATEVKEEDSVTDGEVDALKAQLEESNTALKAEAEKVAQLKEENTALKGFVDEAITLPKGTAPDGYEA
ncbi:MAG: hypothetical protein U9N33_09935 [Campylobacterota bacterium]|nr:hypothetical protein [Campylobacterota bacterium]